ncbi:MAG TPA: hypothetical protein VGR78_04235, partial [Verrucomicrobiae bacterium]|nr:hypothetical protein [Verrucomicrobiae bacterium]
MLARICCLLSFGGILAGAQDMRWSWQEPYAKVLPNGDLEWAPHPFKFTPGESIRYIDFESGNDSNDGASKQTPWKHHPWDPKATGNSAASHSQNTYVFKTGVAYRGRLIIKDAGRAGDPIHLTSDPDWGSGEAVLCGSELVKNWTKGATRKDIPEPEKVWWTDLDFASRSVWTVGKDGAITRIPLARTPNWKVSNPDDVKSEWWVWDNPGKPFGNTTTNARGRTISLGIDTKHIKDKPEDYFKGATIWPEYGWVMSGPYPTPVETVDLQRHGLGFAGWTGGGVNGVIMRNMRYYLEDKPQYLDDPEGEYWFEKKGNGGRLYLRLADDADPNV